MDTTVIMVDSDYPTEWLDAAIGTRFVGMDIETSGLDWKSERIATIQMYVPDVGTVMVRNMDNPVNVLKILESNQVVKIFHHAPFDLSFLCKNYEVYPNKIACTMIAAKILDPNKTRFIHPITGKGSYSLLSLVHHYFGDLLDKTLAVSDWFAPSLSSEQLQYAAKDVIYLPALLRHLEIGLSKVGKIRLARKTMGAVSTNVLLQIKGFENIYAYQT